MLNKAISFFPALRVMGLLIMKRGIVPFPDPLAEEKHKLDASAHYGILVTKVWFKVRHLLHGVGQNMFSYFQIKTRD